MEVLEAKRLKTLEDENTRLMRLLADAMDNAALKDLLEGAAVAAGPGSVAPGALRQHRPDRLSCGRGVPNDAFHRRPMGGVRADCHRLIPCGCQRPPFAPRSLAVLTREVCTANQIAFPARATPGIIRLSSSDCHRPVIGIPLIVAPFAAHRGGRTWI